MNFLLIKIIVINQNFATISAQTALFDELTHQIPNTTYHWGKPSQDVLFAWVYILSELQKTQQLPATLRPLEQKLPLSRIVSCFFEKPVDYYRYLKHLEVLKQPLYHFYQSGLPLDVIGKEYYCDLENGATVYKAGVPALWPLKVLDSLNSMPEPQKKLWLQVWQHAAANNTTLLPSDDWLQAASQLVVALQPSFSKQINKWLVEIVADVFRKDNSFSEHNQHVVCGLLWFASFGDVKILEKVVTKYAKFFFCRSINIALVATDCLEKWQLLD